MPGANRQRQKDGQIIANEALALEENGQKREEARRRQEEAARQTNAQRWGQQGEPSLQEALPEATGNGHRAGQSRDAIGAAIGVSGKTAEQAGAVERAARALDAAGQAIEARHVA